MNSSPGNPSPEAINAFIGQQIKDIREKVGLTAEALAAATGITAAEISHFEAGRDKIPADHLFRLAGFFKVSPNYFFQGLIPHLPSRNVSDDDIHQLIQNFLKVEGSGRGDMFKNFVKAVTEE